MLVKFLFIISLIFGCWFITIGLLLVNSLSWSKEKYPWKGIGFSDHNVPSLSKTAILSLGGIKLSRLLGSVIFFTKVIILSFTIPPFQEDKLVVSLFTSKKPILLIDESEISSILCAKAKELWLSDKEKFILYIIVKANNELKNINKMYKL